MRVPTIIILTFASLTLLTCSGESKSQITGNSIPRSDQTFFLDENDYDVGCVDQTLGTKATDELFYGGRSPEQVEVDRIALCEKGMAGADSNEPTSGATQMSMETQEQPQQRPRSDEGSDAKRESRDRERPRAGDGAAQALHRNERDQPSMDDRRQDPNNRDDKRPQSMCTGNDLDRGGLPLGPKCNVPLPQLPPGVTRATLASASLPKSNYQEPIESCQEFTGDQCSELTWEPVADMRAGEFVQIKISPSNPNVMYAGVDSNDMTMYRSRDAGASWKLVHVSGHNAGLTINPVNPEIVLYSNLETAVQLSVDGGDTWKSVLGGNPDTGGVRAFTAIAFSSDQANVAYTTALPPGGQRGGIWPAVPSDVFRSTDSGSSWELVGTCETCSSVQNLVVNEQDPDTVWLAADGGLQASYDGGRTWSGNVISYIQAEAAKKVNENTPPQVMGVALQPGNPDTMLAASSEWGMFRSTDAGKTWIQSNSGISTTKLHDVYFANSNPDVAYVATHEGVFRSDDAGKSWKERNNGLTYKFVTPLAIHPGNEDVVYVGTSTEVYTTHPGHKNRGLHDGEGLYKSVNGGENWSRSDAGIYEAKIAQMGAHPLLPFNLWVGGESGRGNFFSPDGGESWLFGPSITSHYPMVYAFTYDFPTVIYTTGWLATGELTASNDGGASWYTLTRKLDEGLSKETRELGLRLEGPADFHIHGVAVAPSDSSVIYVGSVHDSVYPDLTFNLEGAHIFKSADGGETFPEMSNGFPIETKTSINAIVVHPTNPDIAYAMTSLHESETAIGIYKTTSGAESWFAVNDGLDQYTNDLQIDPLNPEILYAASESGIYKTTNGGEKWSRSSRGLPKGPVIDMAIDPLNPLTLYAMTPDNIYRTQDGAVHWYPVSFGLPLLAERSKPLSAQERLFGKLQLDPTKTGHSVYGATFAQDRTLEIDATGRIITVAVKTNRNDKDATAERLLYRAVLGPLVNVDYEFAVKKERIKATSSSHVYDMVLDENSNEVRFMIGGPKGTQSQTSVLIPPSLLSGKFEVFISGKRVNSSKVENVITFTYSHEGRTAVTIRAH
ncbi:MAG: hypothetical protein VX724_04680 [Chloroflexota bacterium]|nr:hypothetical protein [Chloroflexota bacterium]